MVSSSPIISIFFPLQNWRNTSSNLTERRKEKNDKESLLIFTVKNGEAKKKKGTLVSKFKCCLQKTLGTVLLRSGFERDENIRQCARSLFDSSRSNRNLGRRVPNHVVFLKTRQHFQTMDFFLPLFFPEEHIERLPMFFFMFSYYYYIFMNLQKICIYRISKGKGEPPHIGRFPFFFLKSHSYF